MPICHSTTTPLQSGPSFAIVVLVGQTVFVFSVTFFSEQNSSSTSS
jgi:hypothetical protein